MNYKKLLCAGAIVIAIGMSASALQAQSTTAFATTGFHDKHTVNYDKTASHPTDVPTKTAIVRNDKNTTVTKTTTSKQTAVPTTTTNTATKNLCPYHENCDGTHANTNCAYHENCDGTHSNTNCTYHENCDGNHKHTSTNGGKQTRHHGQHH